MELRFLKKTVFIVDDEPAILSLVAKVRADDDHTIPMANTGPIGLPRSREFKGEIDLLLADLQMPGMSGVDLAIAMTLDRPQLKVLLMSGLPDGILVFNEGRHFPAKPFVTSLMQHEPE